MSEMHLQCVKCKKGYELKELYLCDECGGILEVRHNYSAKKEAAIDELQKLPSFNIWKYQSLLPVEDSEHMVTLFEGGTPLIKGSHLSKNTGYENLFFKDESRNPSGAFKDRPMAVGVSKAKEFGRDIVVTASSGNAAASLATYAAKAGLKSYIFIPESTPPGKVTQAFVNGGIIIKVRGSYSNAYSIAKMAAREFHWMNITTTFLNPYSVEGDKTIAYELYHQLDRNVPDWILVPTGAGPLVFGIYKGFMELNKLGLAGKKPRMAAVQAEGCAPIVRAFKSGVKVEAWGAPGTVASAIADPLKGYEQDGELVLEIVRDSDGTVEAVSEDEILGAVFDLAKKEGIYSEPGAAVSYAGFKKLAGKNIIKEKQTAVCIITGHGLKDPGGTATNLDVPVIEPDLEELKAYIK
jgi:threonine synthase